MGSGRIAKMADESDGRLLLPSEIVVCKSSDKAGGATLRHRHNYVQSGLLLSGAYRIDLDDTHHMDVRPGDFFCVARRQEHIVAASGPEDVDCLDLRFKVRDAECPCPDARLDGSRMVGVMAGRTFKIAAGHTRQIRLILESMLSLMPLPDDVRGLALCMRMMALASLVECLPLETCKDVDAQRPGHLAVVKALDIIHNQYRKPLSVSGLAASAGVSAAHLTRLFQQETGRSPKQHLLVRRIEVAKRLLILRDNASMKDIAFQTGFADQHQFSRTFRRMAGCAPSEFLA